jgi:hypothetical protein
MPERLKVAAWTRAAAVRRLFRAHAKGLPGKLRQALPRGAEIVRAGECDAGPDPPLEGAAARGVVAAERNAPQPDPKGIEVGPLLDPSMTAFTGTS